MNNYVRQFNCNHKQHPKELTIYKCFWVLFLDEYIYFAEKLRKDFTERNKRTGTQKNSWTQLHQCLLTTETSSLIYMGPREGKVRSGKVMEGIFSLPRKREQHWCWWRRYSRKGFKQLGDRSHHRTVDKLKAHDKAPKWPLTKNFESTGQFANITMELYFFFPSPPPFSPLFSTKTVPEVPVVCCLVLAQNFSKYLRTMLCKINTPNK